MNTSEAGYVPVQFGMTAGADFEANTMTLEMEPGYVVSVGPVAVLPRHTYEELLELLQGVVHFSDGFGLYGDGPAAQELRKWINASRTALAKLEGK